MSGHVAPEELLLDYAAGTLPPKPALAVALREEQLKQALDEFSNRLLGKPGL